MEYQFKVLYNILIITLIILISIINIKSQILGLDTYDACAYVGTSNQPELPEFCLKTDPNCCYFAFEWQDKYEYVYYACVNKKRLIDSVKKNNMTAAFLYETSDDNYKILNNIVYVECADNKGVIVSNKKKMQAPSLNVYQRRRLTQKSFQDFYEEIDENTPLYKKLYRKINYFFDEILYYVLDLFNNFIKMS